MNKQLIIDSAKCTGCGLCQIACAITKKQQCEPSLARIKIWREETQGLFIPMVCQQCENSPCADACLMNIIIKNPVTGVTIRNLDACIACRACQVACPFEASHYDYLQEAVVNCDLCDGSPECVQYCPTGALKYGFLNEVLDDCRHVEALRRICT
jgi:anaerobic carbon-monoxide dehydrogenase iron sulfur subunit